MSTTFKLKRKLYGEYGQKELGLLREAKAAGLSANEQRQWVKMNRGNSSGGNMVSLTGVDGKTAYGQTVKTNATQAAQNVTKQQTTIANQQAKNAARRAANKANPAAAKQTAMMARNKGYQAGFAKGQSSVGIRQGMRNTWNRMGRAGKIGTIAGGLALGGLALKGAKDAVD